MKTNRAFIIVYFLFISSCLLGTANAQGQAWTNSYAAPSTDLIFDHREFYYQGAYQDDVFLNQSSRGNLILTYLTYEEPNRKCVMRKVTSAGKKVWTKEIPYTQLIDQLITPSGDIIHLAEKSIRVPIYETSKSGTSTSVNVTVVSRYDADGNLKWEAQRLGLAESLQLLANGTIFVQGRFRDHLTGNRSQNGFLLDGLGETLTDISIKKDYLLRSIHFKDTANAVLAGFNFGNLFLGKNALDRGNRSIELGDQGTEVEVYCETEINDLRATHMNSRGDLFLLALLRNPQGATLSPAGPSSGHAKEAKCAAILHLSPDFEFINASLFSHTVKERPLQTYYLVEGHQDQVIFVYQAAEGELMLEDNSGIRKHSLEKEAFCWSIIDASGAITKTTSTSYNGALRVIPGPNGGYYTAGRTKVPVKDGPAATFDGKLELKYIPGR